MTRTWSTFNAPPQWGKMTGIPSDFSDGKIGWGETQNKPTAFTPSTHFHSPSTLQGVEQYDNNTLLGQAINALLSPASTLSGRLEKSLNNANYVIFIDANEVNDSFAIVSRSVSSDPAFGQNPDLLILRIRRSGLTQFYGAVEVRNSSLSMLNLPTLATGLQSGQVWRDNNGFLRIV